MGRTLQVIQYARLGGKQNLKDKNRYFQLARGSALECAAAHHILTAFGVIDEEADRQRKSQLKRIVSMLTRLIQRTDRVVDAVQGNNLVTPQRETSGKQGTQTVS